MSSTEWELETLLCADGFFFARGVVEGSNSSGKVLLSFENERGERCGSVFGNSGKQQTDTGNGTFVFCGDTGQLKGADYCRLCIQYDDHDWLSLSAYRIPTEVTAQRESSRRLSLWSGYARQALNLLRAGRLSVLSEKLRRYVAPVGGRRIGSDALNTWLGRYRTGRLTLMVDHGLGGGASHYCQDRVTDIRASGNSALLVCCEPVSGGYVLSLYSPSEVSHRRIGDLAYLGKASQLRDVDEVVYNTAAHFFRPLALVALMIQLSQRTGARLRILFHDYFTLCPSAFLLDRHGRYCGIPDAETCRNCLPVNAHLPLRLYNRYDTEQWRQIWWCLLILADELVAFSSASAAIIRKVWPAMDQALKVIPHRANRAASSPVKLYGGDLLHIGVVGQIGYHKGAGIVTALAMAVRRRELGVRITVIGTLEAAGDDEVVRQTGHYSKESLPELIAGSGANVMLFPSVWPETFSFVVQELMSSRLPVACFDLGAPAERVSDYDLGLILEDDDPDAVLDNLMAFHGRLYPDTSVHTIC